MAGDCEGFDRHRGIRVFEDEAFKRWIVSASLAVFALGALIGVLALLVDGHLVEGLGDIVGSVPRAMVFLIVMVASLLVHELVHGLFFKLFSPPGSKVAFGANWKAGMLYACAEGVVYPRSRYQVIIIAPTVVVTALLLLGGALTGHFAAGYALAVVHLSGCTGDWGYLVELARDPTITHCEDTPWGVRFLRDGDAGTSAVTGEGGARDR